MDKKKRCLWRKLGRVKKKLLVTSSVKRASSLLQSKQKLEKELKELYAIQGWEAENKVVKAMKTNIKAFFAYGRARQKTKAKVGPFLDPDTGIPNPDPDYAAHILSEQYSSVFTTPRAEFIVENLEEFFSGGQEWREQHHSLVGHFYRMSSSPNLTLRWPAGSSSQSPPLVQIEYQQSY